MSQVATTELTLTELRKRSGKQIKDIIAQALEVDPNFPRTHAGVLGIEELGTRDWWKIHALAHVFGVDPSEVAEIARPKN